jgi:aminoglycoside 6'-N-acetyltransferase I
MQKEPIPVVVRAITPTDAPAWEAMRRDLWPGDDAGHAAEINAFFANTLEEPVAVLVAENAAGAMVGFAELSIRFDVAGLAQKRAGYVEGLYVSPPARGRGVTGELFRAVRRWAREQGCVALASDRAERVIVDRHFQRTE